MEILGALYSTNYQGSFKAKWTAGKMEEVRRDPRLTSS